MSLYSSMQNYSPTFALMLLLYLLFCLCKIFSGVNIFIASPRTNSVCHINKNISDTFSSQSWMTFLFLSGKGLFICNFLFFCFWQQEVETEQYYNFFLPELKEQGYDGFFSPKSRARTMSEVDRKHVDGCAIFYKTEKYVATIQFCNCGLLSTFLNYLFPTCS